MRLLSVAEMSNMRSLNFLLVLCFAVLFFDRTSVCLYEDQAGTFDWRLQYVGKAKFIEYIQGGQSGTRIIVGTEQNVVAAINGKNGQIGWRQVLEKGSAGRIDDLLVSGQYVVAASAGGEHIRCFNSISGSLHWEASVPGAVPSHQASIQIFGLGHVAVLSIDRLTVFSLELGNELWSTTLPDSGKLTYSHVAFSDERIYVVGVSDRSHVSVISVRQDGSEKTTRNVPAAWMSAGNRCSVLRGAHLVCVDKTSAIVQILALTNGASFLPLVLQDMKIDYKKVSFPRLQLASDASAPVVMAMQVNDRDHVLIAIDNGKAVVLRYLPEVAALQVMNLNEHWTLLTVQRSSQQTELLSVNGYDLLTGSPVTGLVHSLKYPSHHGQPRQLYGMLSRNRDGTTGFNILLLAEDHSLVLLPHSGKGFWTREEALASVLSVEMVDLPVSQIMAKMEDEFGTKDNIFQMFLKRFSTQLAQLWTFALQLKQRLRIPRQHHHPLATDGAGGGEVDKDDGSDEEDVLDESYLTRDDFNLHKIIVVATSPGKVFGLDSNTGASIWKTFYPNLGSFVRLHREVLPLFVQRTTAHFPHQPVCTVLGKDKVSDLPIMFSFHPITGLPSELAPPEGRRLDYKVVNAIMLTQMDDQFLHPLIIMDSEKKFYVFPEGDADLVKDLAETLFVFTTNIDTGIITGYGLTTDNKNQLIGNQLWTVDTNKNTQTITKVLTKRAIEHVHSQGIVLEDRSVQYKYLNPNLIAVLTEGEEPQQKASAFFTVYLIDGVTGNLLFHCTHKRSKGPIHLIHSENWIVYNYWNQKQRRMELAVLELYEGTHQSNATAFSSFHPPPPPIVMRQAYIFPGHIAAMATTITEKGITSKELLFALETGGILGLPKILIDPRRPEVLSQEAREEGLVPYLPELPRPPDHIVNYHQSVLDIRGIHTAPAGLESTSLILCYGLDLFYTRVMPSKMFDVLKEDFDYFFISSVLVGMIAVSLITQRLAARKALNRAWK